MRFWTQFYNGLYLSNVHILQPPGASKVDQVKAQVKEFTLDTFRTTKQLFSEIMGKGTKTVDPQIDGKLAYLKWVYVIYKVF